MTRPAVAADPPGTAPGGSPRLYPADVARLAGVRSVATINKYNSIAKRNRAAGTPGPRDLPAPVDYEQRQHGPPTPWWYAETIRPWLDARWNPGRPGDGGTTSARPSAGTRARAGRKPRAKAKAKAAKR